MTNEENFEEVELAGTEQVKSYQRRAPNGQVYTVRGYVRTDNSAVADRARQSPGRPAIAASSGRFPQDRAIPVWPDAGRSKVTKTDPDLEEAGYEGMEDTGEVDQEALDKEVPVALEVMSQLPPNPALKKLLGILRSLSSASLSNDLTFDPTIVELAIRSVRISGYSYISKKTGKVVRVNPYTQMRRLINAMGGPTMAAKKGVTPDLVDKAMPGFQMKDKVFKAKKTTNKLTPSARKAGRISNKKAQTDINKLPIDRVIDLPAPKTGEDFMRKAMSPQHPLEGVRNSREGSRVTRGTDSWQRGMDGLWYKTPRRNNKGVTDKELTRRLASKGGQIEVSHAEPAKRKTYPLSQVDYTSLNPNSTNYIDAVKYTKSLEPTFRALPEGLADSINGNVEVRKLPGTSSKNYTAMTKVSTTKANNYYPKLRVHSNPEFEADLIDALPKQQREGYSVPTILHPLETVMARESSAYVESLMNSRAPADMVDRMYSRLNAAYDKNTKNDDGDYSGLTGKDGWIARMTGDRSDDLRQELRDNVSMSALKSPEDFLAETWTEYVGNPAPRPMAKDMGEAFQRSMEEFSDYLFKNKWVDASEIPEATYTKSTKKSISRKVSDVIGGAEDYTVETNVAPRDLRAILRHSSKYVDIRDEEGNPTFDAEITREGSTAKIGTLSYPVTDPSTQPSGIPDLPFVNIQEGARYYSTPIQDLAKGPDNKKRYADFIDQEKAILAIEAVEESMFYEGVRRFEVNARAGEDSVLYARAGYAFNPNTTDAYEVSNILNDIEEMMDYVAEDGAEGYWALPPQTISNIKRKVSTWQKNMTAAPETWPTPKAIANLGKLQEDDKSVGEAVLDRYAWNGVKELSGDTFPAWSPDAWEVDDDDDGYLPTPITPTDEVSASAINAVSRAMDGAGAVDGEDELPEDEYEDDMTLMNALADFANEVLKRHTDLFPGATPLVRGNSSKHSLQIRDNKGNTVMSMQVKKLDDNTVEWSGPKHAVDDFGSVFLTFDMIDHLESSYQQSLDIKTIRKRPKPDDTVANYVMATIGYNWEKPPTREYLETVLRNEVDAQAEASRQTLEKVLAHRYIGASTEDLIQAQKEMYATVDKLYASLDAQVSAYLEKFDDPDYDGPTPFEIAQIGKKEAYMVNQARLNAPDLETGSSGGGSRRPPRGGESTGDLPEEPTWGSGSLVPSPPVDPGENATQAERDAYTAAVEAFERDQDRFHRSEGTLLQQMTSFDGDPLHDSFAEFVGKQALTLGAYGWYKTLGGYWDWAADSYKPSVRKQSVSLLFMLLRLLPASPMRGSFMMLANTITKKLESPRPEDWPSAQEIEDLKDKIIAQLPDPEEEVI